MILFYFVQYRMSQGPCNRERNRSDVDRHDAEHALPAWIQSLSVKASIRRIRRKGRTHLKTLDFNFSKRPSGVH